MVAALERMAPAVSAPCDWVGLPGYRLSATGLSSIEELAAIPSSRLIGVDNQKQLVRENLVRLASGHAAHDILLWGARGMGKSALLVSAIADIQRATPKSIALVEIAHDAIGALPSLFDELAKQDRSFLLLIDDLGFGPDGIDQVLSLRSALEGGITPRPKNVRIGVTSNRRSIVKRNQSEQNSPLHDRDDRDDSLALADRFGLSLGFHPCDQDTYLAIVAAYLAPLDLTFDEEAALAWAIDRGARSGRIAHQFATEIAGRSEMSLD